MATRVFFVGAGPGDPELLTIKAKSIIEQADVIIYADSLINPEVCSFARKGAEIHRSASLNLQEITEIIVNAVEQDKLVVRLQSGDPSIYGAIREQMSVLDEKGIEYDVIPGVSSLFAAASALKRELTVPEVSQTVIVTRMEGRTPVPKLEKLESLAKHQSTMAIFLSMSLIDRVVSALLKGGYTARTPAAIVYKASWKDEAVITTDLEHLCKRAAEMGIKKQALILIGNFLSQEAGDQRSKLYHKEFEHGFRQSA